MPHADPLTPRILAEISRDPTRLGREIAAAVGCSAVHVTRVAQQNGLAFGKTHKRGVPGLSPENKSWVEKRSSEMGLSHFEFINACLTDARLDEEDSQ